MSEVVFASRASDRMHYHPDAFLTLILQGDNRERYGSGHRDLPAGSSVYYEPGAMHDGRFGNEGARVFVVELPPDFRIPQRGSLISSSQATDGLRGSVTHSLLYCLYRELASPPLDEFAIETLGQELLFDLGHRLGRIDTAPSWVRRVRDLLHDRFAEPISLAVIADELGLHPVYLARAFHTRFGCTMGLYVRRLRFARACTLLSTTDTPVATVAISSGFADQSHLGRLVKAYTGLSTGQFRKRLRKDR